ncbi:hypothetical protein CO057_00670 [Candidatus Uhrbacteria bacterium CG_4_9_14_0_2_um_filter_41_50]|uniref:DDH domain-containing protein n=1 Tax=Candidatus Uhrbacteria bacterium CG_4_9_14_0_2_um_filter_41_50 TaxID=1975031 RepID=A0A2M8EQ91_9BACT|nr:MAG: hypothetical protein COZ45_02075 [Candidatus Uhrbacteria bacterium CG_4_10_14_3_um_filter_41_21]PIZ54696.1 MAG: hypothetical protein COY24_02925 [Candidatus Uhrbacteria bacterium CG_4_10_14_0_2_um_filter_41_21]PJB84745.1 MAG: hypothetical protein CO086_01990 [Candidatus Uhrbacteria bacterium CG_4_9_14_0_8_um_filter_41_16]PJC24847.1 MAG: hypothetical protein CO057_00670 [Candidatus Uhrbacteria bacterium CG_4_9_14_0_2_um_filter_41_50]PJE75247.1 MAG: hypothetical protein COV03_01260 [Candi
MASILYKQIKERLDGAEHILLLTDERIDGDTVSSTLGMYHVLKELGKEVSVYSPQPMAKMLEFIPGTEVICRDKEIFKDGSIDLMMIFDCGDGEYIKEPIPSMPKKVPLIVFDHHDSNPKYGSINVIDSTSAATAGMVWGFVKEVGLPMNQKAAQCFLTGICSDTNLFLTSNTTAACLDAAHELSVYGARFKEIVDKLMMSRSVPTLRLWGLAFERLYHDDNFGVLATAITQKDLKDLGVEDADYKSMINFLNAALDGIDTILVLKETEDGAVKGGLRSQTEDCIAFAEKYGGGGHRRAAGFKIENARLEEKDGKWFVKKG